MREAELLAALGQADGGVQVNVSRKGITVATRYTPLVKYTAPRLMLAAFEVAVAVQHDRRCPPAVLKALEAYDKHKNCRYEQ